MCGRKGGSGNSQRVCTVCVCGGKANRECDDWPKGEWLFGSSLELIGQTDHTSLDVSRVPHYHPGKYLNHQPVGKKLFFGYIYLPCLSLPSPLSLSSPHNTVGTISMIEMPLGINRWSNQLAHALGQCD